MTATTTVLAPTIPTVFGQAATFSATVQPTGGGGTPTGTVTFTIDGGTPSTPVALAAGTASFLTSTLAAGTHSVIAIYSGAANFTPSTSSAGTQVVAQDGRTSVVGASPGPSVFGQTVTFTATVSANAPGSGTPTGTVTFTASGVPPQTVTLSGGQATFSTSTLPVGPYTVLANYSGDGNFVGSIASTSQTVNQASTTTTLGSAPSPSSSGQTVTFTATVAQSAPGSGTPTGTVTFTIDGTPRPPVALSGGGQAAFSISSLPVGPHTVTATYSGDVNFIGSSNSVSQNVQGGTTTVVTSSLNPSAFGQAVTFTATVTGASPTGTVTFKDGGSVLATAPLGGGAAAFTISTLAVGTHSITATYNGDATNLPSTSAVLTESVNVPADSVKLRALQLAVTKIEAQSSGAATSGAIDNAIADGFSENSPLINGNNNGVHFNFTADPAPQQDKQTFEERAGNAFAGLGYAAPPLLKAPPRPAPRDWFLWADVTGTGWATSVPTGDIHGGQTNGLAGLTRKLTPDFLVGAFAGAETFDYTSQLLNGRLKGTGWTTGTYLGWRILSGVRLEAGAAYSGIGYDGVSGTASGSFPGQRWLATGALVGTTRAVPGFEIENSLRVYGLWEHENAYTDSLGIVQDGHDFSTGRASAGSKVSYPWMWSGDLTVIPYVGAYADYYFNNDNGTLPAAATPVLLPTEFIQGWSARLTSGIGLKTARGANFSLGGEVGGLGSGQFTNWTLRGRAAIPF